MTAQERRHDRCPVFEIDIGQTSVAKYMGINGYPRRLCEEALEVQYHLDAYRWRWQQMHLRTLARETYPWLT